jgi:hypothetical protein
MKKFLILLLITFQVINKSNGQVLPAQFTSFELSFRARLDSVKALTSDSLVMTGMQSLQNELITFLENPASFNYPLDSIKNIGKIKSPDDQFRLISWNVLINKNSFKNFCLVQLNPEKEEKCNVIILTDNSNIDSVGNKTLKAEQWYGALYYKIIPTKISGENYYILLGLDSNSPYISKKVIDVLILQDNSLSIGAPIFNIAGKLKSRMVFSYSARQSMMLNYDENLKTIVFDHLSPSEPRYTGQFEYYGPDFSFDGFQYNKKDWLFTEDVKPNKPAERKKEKTSSHNLR